MPASKFWYVGMYVSARSRFVKKSTRCERLIDAKDFAKDWYEERVLERRNNKVIEEQSFAAFAQRFQTTQKRQISRGELVEEMLYNDKLKLDNDLLPYLGLSRTRFPWTQNWLNRSVQGGPEHDR